jgi:tetratricopeptide (TPR) repeat protein
VLFQALAEDAEPKLRSAEQVMWLDRFEVDHDNLRVALDWSLSHENIEAGLRLAGSLFRFWYLRGYWREGREWLERMLAKAGNSGSALARAKALYGMAWLADENGQEAALYAESLALCRENGDKWGAAFSLRGLGVRTYLQGEYEQAERLLNESLALFREMADKWGMALALFNLGWSASDRDDQQRAALWNEVWPCSVR